MNAVGLIGMLLSRELITLDAPGDRDRSERHIQLGKVETLAGGAPVLRRELEDAVLGPGRQDAEEIAQVGLRVEPVQLARGNERHEGAGPLGGVVAADEEPVGAADDETPELELAPVVVDGDGCGSIAAA